MTTPIMIAAEEMLGTEKVNKEDYDYYRLDIYTGNDMEYAIGIKQEVDEAVRNYIRDSLWTFRTEFILKHSRVGESKKIIKALEEMQAKLSEDCNEIVYALLEDFDKFAKAAVEADGRGVFLATYDSEETEVDVNGITFYCYRTN